MRRVVIDTNVYIDWLNSRRHAAVVFQRDAVKYLSAVVLMELYAGASSRRHRRVVGDVI
jgi:predicted nucleic acid-binding protein